MLRKGKSLWIIPLLILQLSCANNRKTIANNSETIKELIQLEKPSILKILEDHSHLKVEERIALYHQLKNESKRPDLFMNEAELNLYGYSLLWSEKTEEALEIFKLVVAEFPDSWNAYDSLGEAYLALGKKEESLKNYEKSLDLNPDNFYAKDNIKIIKFPGTKFLSPEEKFDKIYSKEAYFHDLDQLGNKLVSVNPNALLFISKEDFWSLVEEKKSLITDSTTYAEFRWHCNEIISSISCSHTTMDRFFTENRMLPTGLRFPIQVRWIDHHLYVTDPLNNIGKVKIKDEIKEINGYSVDTLIENIYRHIQSQGLAETPKGIEFNRWAMSMIPYELNFPKQYSILLKWQTEEIILTQAVKNNGSIANSSIDPCESNLCLEFLEDSTSAILTISSFVYYRKGNYDEFVDFIDQTMKEISDKEVRDLIIDLRFNGGGAPEASIHLLKYLMKHPFTYYSRIEGTEERNVGIISDGEQEEKPFKNRYNGETYFLIDGNGESTTGHFMSIAKAEKLGAIIGEELGSNQLCTAGGIACRLDSTRIDYYVADTSCETYATELPVDRGILPDYYVTQSIDEYLNKVDAVKEFAISLIAEKKVID